MEFKKGQTAWNKGLTKKTDERMKSISEKNKLNSKGIHKSLRTEFKKGCISFNKGQTYEEVYGKEKAEKIKEKMRKAKLGKSTWNKGKRGYNAGDKHYNWKGGITPINKLLRLSSMWRIWREAVFLRDNFTCQNPNCEFCNNQIGIKLHPHHIKSLANNPELVFKVDNGITYCEEFHIKSGLHKGIMQGVKNRIL